LSLALTRDGYREVLDDLGLGTFPRQVGTPGRVIVGGWRSFFEWFDRNYGKTVPMFVAHNAFDPPDLGGPVDINRFVLSATFGDMDTGDNSGLRPDEVFLEVRRTTDWLDHQRLGYSWKNSGSDGGFHLRIRWAVESHPRSYLSRWESAFWRGLKHHLSLRSVNIVCAEPSRFERLPYTPYVHRKDPTVKDWKREPTYCVPIPVDWIRTGRYDKIRDLSLNPYDVGRVAIPGSMPPPSLESFVRKMGWENFAHEADAFHPAPTEIELGAAGGVIDVCKELIPEKLCLRTLPYGLNPKHSVRLAWFVEILATDPEGFSLDEAQALVDAVAEEAKWEDRANTNRRREQVADLWKRKYAPKSCGWLREKGVCVENAIRDCPVFPRSFPQEHQEYLLQHPEARKEIPA
jgi:hypothetical protein